MPDMVELRPVFMVVGGTSNGQVVAFGENASLPEGMRVVPGPKVSESVTPVVHRWSKKKRANPFPRAPR